MATASGTQYDRCSGSTSLTKPATPMQTISRSVKIRLSLPPPNASSSRPATRSGQPAGLQGPQLQQRVLAIAGVRWPYQPGSPPGSGG